MSSVFLAFGIVADIILIVLILDLTGVINIEELMRGKK